MLETMTPNPPPPLGNDSCLGTSSCESIGKKFAGSEWAKRSLVGCLMVLVVLEDSNCSEIPVPAGALYGCTFEYCRVVCLKLEDTVNKILTQRSISTVRSSCPASGPVLSSYSKRLYEYR
jgi:hypothetical protein